jgi:hypothetical protein
MNISNYAICVFGCCPPPPPQINNLNSEQCHLRGCSTVWVYIHNVKVKKKAISITGLGGL